MIPGSLPDLHSLSLSNNANNFQHYVGYPSQINSNPYETHNLLDKRSLLPSSSAPPTPKLSIPSNNAKNCSPDVFRCTLNKIPESEALLKKVRLPLGILLHPFKDLSYLTVIQCPTIVRCRQCRTYINPFVQFIDQRRWKCNICFRINEVPEEFLYDPSTKSYGDPSRRPEVNSSTIEFIAPSEYMLRPPQPAVYLFCLDVSRQAWESGYINEFCRILLEELDKLPGDGRTQIGFVTFDKSVHFYSCPPGALKPTQMTVSDVDDMFLPSPNDLIVNLEESRSLVETLLKDLPDMFENTSATDSALGAALQACYKLLYPTGGRVTVFQYIIPNIGPGSLARRDKVEKKDSVLYGPAVDFYKKLALDFSGQQIAVDLFSLGNQYQDLASVGGISKFSGGQISSFPGLHVKNNVPLFHKFETFLHRYLTRKLGFEAVMRVRCTRGLSLTAFHGNFFVRSTDLLSLPNINPDAGFGMQLAIEEDLHDTRDVSFQAALLYTSSKGERRIRVHTLCVPTTASLIDTINYADQEAITGMLAKFAVERAVNYSIAEAKEGLIVSCVDAFETYGNYSGGIGGGLSTSPGLLISDSLKLLPLNVLALLKSNAFRQIDVEPDVRSFAFSQLKTLPLTQLMLMIYPSLYRVDNLTALENNHYNNNGGVPPSNHMNSVQNNTTTHSSPVIYPPRLQLSYENISATGVYLMDTGDEYILYLTRGVHEIILDSLFGKKRLSEIDETAIGGELPHNPNPISEKLRSFIDHLDASKSYAGTIRVLREDSDRRRLFVNRLIEDKSGNLFSYYEFLHHLKQQLK